jgi:hypothetical protein
MKNSRNGLSLLQLIAASTLIGIFAVVVLARFGTTSADAKSRACLANRRNIEVQCRLWYRTKGVWPVNTLSDLGADANYLPAGMPTCPVDGSAYSFDSASGTVTGHAH